MINKNIIAKYRIMINYDDLKNANTISFKLYSIKKSQMIFNYSQTGINGKRYFKVTR